MDQGEQNVEILGVNIFATNINDCLKKLEKDFDDIKSRYICFANVYTTVMAKERSSYCTAQNASYMTLADGKPLSLITKLYGFGNSQRVTGPDFLEAVLKKSATTGWKHFFYGNTEENLEKIICFLRNNYIHINIAGYEHSVFRDLTKEEEEKLLKKINESETDFVWVAIGAPAQEFFCNKLSNKTNAIWVGVGGAFNTIAGIIPRAPKWMQNYYLEWLFRLLQEPKRLFTRYFFSNLKFVFYILQDFFRVSK